TREYSVGLIYNKLLVMVCDDTELTPFAMLEVHQTLRTDAAEADFRRSVLALADLRQVRVSHVSYMRHFTDAEGFGRRDILRNSNSQMFRFFGRQAELSFLDSAWNSRGAQRVLCIIAEGGYGKTTVAQKWLADNL